MKTQNQSGLKPLNSVEEIQNAYDSLAEIQRGRSCIVRFVALAEEARYLDPQYLTILSLLCDTLTRGHFNGTIVQAGSEVLRKARGRN